MKRQKKLNEKALRKSIIDVALAMSRSGLSPGRSGNVSARVGDGMLITPTGMNYEALEPADIVFVNGDGRWDDRGRKPSSEWQFHLAIYKARGDRHAVVHTHSMHATVLACARRSIPAFHYMVAAVGGMEVSCVPYATFGTADLAGHVAAGLSSADACLMANHGQVAIGETLEGALELAHEVEILAEQYFKVLCLGGVNLLSDAEMRLMIDKFRHYGQKAQPR